MNFDTVGYEPTLKRVFTWGHESASRNTNTS